MLQVSHLYIYPVKSLGGIEVQSADVTDRGFKHDRRWMLVDDNGLFISQREHAQMALFKTAIEDEGISVSYGDLKFLIPYHPLTDNKIDVTVWDDTCTAILVDSAADKWFAEILGLNCRLVYMPDDSYRLIDPKYAHQGEVVSFADGYPFLMIGESSLTDFNGRIDQQLPMDRFRPSIVFTGAEPYAEDKITDFTINNISFRGVKNCARCVVTTIDQQTGAKAAEPLKTLAKYRRNGNKILFGQNVLNYGVGEISVGDELIVNK